MPRTDLVTERVFVMTQSAIDAAGQTPAAMVRPDIWVALVHEYYWTLTGHNLPAFLHHKRDIHQRHNLSARAAALELQKGPPQ